MAKTISRTKKAKPRKATVTKPKQAPASLAVNEELTESLISEEERFNMISEAAYYRAEARGFDPSEQDNDWLEAEVLIDKMLNEAVKEAKY